MSKQQWKLLLCAIAAVAALLVTLFVTAWFHMDVIGNDVEIDLRSASMCAPTGICVSFPMSQFRGSYPLVGNVAFFTGIPVIVVVIIQCASRLVTGTASMTLTKIGYGLASLSLIAGFAAAYVFAPESSNMKELALIVVTRTWAPLIFIVGNIVTFAALYLATATGLDDDVAEYKPIKLDKAATADDKGRLPVTPLSVKGIKGPAPTTPAASPAGSSARERIPDSLPLEEGRRTRKHTPSGQHRLAEPAVRFTPSQQFAKVEEQGKRHTPSQPMPRIDDPTRSKSPSQPPAVARTSSPSGLRSRTPSQPPVGIVEVDQRPKSPSQQPLVARTTSPSGIAVDPVVRARTSSSGPIDLAARLTAAAPQGVLEPLGAGHGGLGVEVSIRPPLPQPEPVPPDQIPVDPAAGLTIRKRPASVAPPIDIPLPPPAQPAAGIVDPKKKTVELPDTAFAPPLDIELPPVGVAVRTTRSRAPSSDGMPGVALEGVAAAAITDELSKPHAVETRVQTKPLPPPSHEPEPVFPPYIQNKINYAITTADLAPAGITAKREDGTVKVVEWDAIVGVIARRLPPDKPFEGATIIDIVSSAGATLRVVPWTKLRGGLPLPPQAVERARSFVNLVAAQALGAKLDPATKLFADSDGQAAQLPTLATLASHDQRLA
ncbi:MAG TPA: hypothetical protein VL326_25340 [Kofleriaceae bacterium]|nr:hypothetical protein [Kofleriaceae bacterium]